MKYIATLLVFVALTLPLSIRADGIGFDGDRVHGWSTTVLTLTPAQIREIEKGSSGERFAMVFISLTDEQQASLQSSAGFVPEKLLVWSLADARESCTCDLLNLGIRFEKGKIEVPHFLLGKDLDDRYARMLKEIEKEKKAEPGATDNPGNAQ